MYMYGVRNSWFTNLLIALVNLITVCNYLGGCLIYLVTLVNSVTLYA